ncbi:hypothetical protein D918_07124 [Trichuris suis]|nr:hypothetical protein D918_07124 [Trichuris suis]
MMHSQCQGFGSLCFQRHCVAGRPIASSELCRNDAQCRRNISPKWMALSVGCKDRHCFELIRVSQNRCVKHSDCTGQTMCIRQVCVSAQPTEYFCRKNNQCGFGEKCIGGLCFQPVPSVPFLSDSTTGVRSTATL